MRLILFAVAIGVIAASLYFDLRWKRWVARQRAQREEHPEEFPRR